MRIKTELSERPPVFRVAHDGEEAVVRFYTDVTEEERDGAPVWEAVEWSMRRPWADTLETRIAANTDLWLRRIRENTEAEERTEAEIQLDTDIAASLPDLVLDLDFRLTLIEEFGF